MKLNEGKDKDEEKSKFYNVDFYQDLSNEKNFVAKTFFRRNKTCKRVTDENKTGAFKADIFSEQFHDFIPKLFDTVLNNDGS